MPWWKQFLLGCYYGTTLPGRYFLGRRMAAAQRAPVLVLFYHRVADDAPSDWTCPTATFARQMRWIKKRFDVVSLSEAQHRIRNGINDRPAISVTFDDGYAENCQFAIPLLLREEIPCTYFVATRYIFEGLPFPHDVSRGRRLPPNTIEQLRKMAAAGIEIGAHTRTHIDLGTVSDEQRIFDEVVTAGEELQAALGHTVRYFAFPYGLHANLNRVAFQMAYEAGYEAVCSAYGAFNFPGDDAFHLQRIHGDPQMVRFKNWTSIDPRKLHVPRFRYELRPAATGTSCPPGSGGDVPLENPHP